MILLFNHRHKVSELVFKKIMMGEWEMTGDLLTVWHTQHWCLQENIVHERIMFVFFSHTAL
jgi:hypothetical protein